MKNTEEDSNSFNCATTDQINNENVNFISEYATRIEISNYHDCTQKIIPYISDSGECLLRYKNTGEQTSYECMSTVVSILSQMPKEISSQCFVTVRPGAGFVEIEGITYNLKLFIRVLSDGSIVDDSVTFYAKNCGAIAFSVGRHCIEDGIRNVYLSKFFQSILLMRDFFDGK